MRVPGSETGPLDEQQVLSTTEPSLLAQTITFFKMEKNLMCFYAGRRGPAGQIIAIITVAGIY